MFWIGRNHSTTLRKRLHQAQLTHTGLSGKRDIMGRRIVAAVDDMIFAAKIKGTAEAIGAHIEFVHSADAAFTSVEREPPALIICDLHSEKCDPFEIARRLKEEPSLDGVPLLGFFSHVNIGLKHSADAAGFDRVLPRSSFVKNLADILSGEF
jgi:CheY-like chemotaxis protein